MVQLSELLQLPNGRRPDCPRQGDHEVHGRVDHPVSTAIVALPQDRRHGHHDPGGDVGALSLIGGLGQGQVV